MHAPIYTINPAGVARTSVEPRRLGAAEFDKEGPSREAGSTLERALQAGSTSSQRWDQPRGYVTTLSSGFGVSEAAAARLTPDVVDGIQARHGVQLAIDRMQLGGSRSFPMVGCSTCSLSTIASCFAS
jgi:hypothetical protein